MLIMLTTMCGTVEAMRLRDALEIDSIRQQWQLRAVTGFNFVDSFVRRHRGTGYRTCKIKPGGMFGAKSGRIERKKEGFDVNSGRFV